MRRDGCSEMPACRRTQDPDAFGIKLPLRGPRANRAQGARGVLQWRGMMITRTKSILEHERGDADRVEPLGDGCAFMGSQMVVSATRTNDDRGARGLLFQRQVRRQR